MIRTEQGDQGFGCLMYNNPSTAGSGYIKTTTCTTSATKDGTYRLPTTYAYSSYLQQPFF
eukprot:NODE_4944_length_437_cov_91.724227_g4280_i0.p1 GENE.NODE_4944_length_437_cov_91.724227_g4280_i0~~NODE_4944_length_437_cov_91.724227_g4280_i0.p1  ORF type:complete len:60 (-),score=2.21 NODE_4944_length_437_cov_91.724227_g4280_i0:67-246(-)